MATENPNPPTAYKLSKQAKTLVTYSITLTIILSSLLLWRLKESFPRDPKSVQQELINLRDSLTNSKQVNLKTNTLPTSDSLNTKMDSASISNLKKATAIEPIREKGADYFDILLMMLFSGGLGGVLCNLRGFFEHFRDDFHFPKELFIPYLVRPLSAAVCGLFIFFVLNLLVTSITVEATAGNIPFQGMVSYLSLAILAGFGSQEFMERLKATAKTLFGEKQRKSNAEQLDDWYKLLKAGVIKDEDFDKKKAELMNQTASSTVDRSFTAKQD